MKIILCYLWFIALMSIGIMNLHAQNPNYYLPTNFKHAYETGTRASNGTSGKNYWQNRANYQIEVWLAPETRTVSGKETITYKNNSPKELNQIVFHLLPNLYKKGSGRNFDIDPRDASDGVEIEKIKFNGQDINPSPGNDDIEYVNNNLVLTLPTTLHSGESCKIDFEWNYHLNENSHYREGVVDNTSFFVAYFFPRVAVYDDIDGWNDWKYTGIAEFYNDFGDFDVTVNVPENYFVWATGDWKNPEKHLKQKYLDRYNLAMELNEITNIITKADLPYNKVLNDKKEWIFEAKNVSDFAFGVSDHYLMDATSLEVDPETGRRVNIYAAYNQRSRDFYEVCEIARNSIEHMSFQFPGIPFPYPKMTVFNGLSEMEYPMMVNDLSNASRTETIKLTSHEIFHTYFPFYTGLNETKYAWMDEGLTSYGESLIATAMDSTNYQGFYFMDSYTKHLGHDFDIPLFVNSEYLSGKPYYSNSYPKAATFFKMLHDLLGDTVFMDCLHAFVNRWNGKHPTPYDFIFTFEDVSGENLSWFIKPWVFEYGYVDFELKSFENIDDGISATIDKLGYYPAPIDLRIIYDDGNEEVIHKNAEIWKNGNSTYTVEMETGKKVRSVELLNILGIDAEE